MRLFYLKRNVDETGISGTGRVMEGVEFTDGRCAMVWQSDWSSGVVSPNINAVEQVHGHNGRSQIHFIYTNLNLECEMKPDIFFLNHTENKFGLTRVGTVAECVHFSNDWVAMRWLVRPYTIEFHTSYENWEKIHASQSHCYLTKYPGNFKLSRTLDPFLSNYRWYRDLAGGDWYYIRTHLMFNAGSQGWTRFPKDKDFVFNIEAR